MRRLQLMAPVAALLVAANPATAAPYVGPVKTATATFAVRGVDGAVYRLELEAIVPGYLPDDEAQLTVNTTRCVRGRCSRPSTAIRTLRATEYADRVDLNVLTVVAKLGSLELAVEWYSPPGFGEGHAASTDGGVAMRSETPSDAVLLIGAHGRYARCTHPKASMAWQAGVLIDGYRRSEAWPDAEPDGLRLAKRSSRTLTCVLPTTTR